MTAAGRQVTGPTSIRAVNRRDELAQTGCARTFRVDSAPIDPDEIVSCTLHAPSGRPAP